MTKMAVMVFLFHRKKTVAEKAIAFHLPGSDNIIYACARWGCPEHKVSLAGVSIPPYRPDALDELDRCVEQGAAAVKWLPTTGAASASLVAPSAA